jgi:NitT/TauT family transport system permease protein
MTAGTLAGTTVQRTWSWRWARRLVPPIAMFVLVTAAWEAGIFHALLRVQEFSLAKPSQILDALVGQQAAMAAQASVTLTEALVGYVLGSTAGFLIAIVAVQVNLVRRLIIPLVSGITAMPVIALAPLMGLYFGPGIESKIAIVAIMTLAPMGVMAFKGLTAVPPVALELLDSYAATNLQTFRKLRLPTSLPFVFQALKLNVPLSLIGAIVGEFFSSLGGLGFYMTFALDRFDAPVAWAIMAIAGVAGVLLYLLVSLIERVAIPWHSSVGGARR